MSAPRHILVIDDDIDTQVRLTVALQSEGFEVTCASDAVTCLAVVRRTHPDLILLDLGLPGGSGLDVLRRVRQISALMTTPVVVFTATETNAARDAAIKAGANEFLGKTATRDQVLGAIGRCLGQA